MTQLFEFDIAIIGGGMVGTSLASLLAASHPHWRIALVEARALVTTSEFTSSFDARSTALSFGSAGILRELGVWDALQQHITSIQQVHVSDRGHFLGGLIDAAELDLEAVGYVVENAWLGNVLLAHVQAHNNIQCFASTSVMSLQPQADGALLHLQADEKTFALKTQLAVIADGGDSLLRTQLGIATQVRDYGQTAIITNVEFSEPHNAIAYERFTDEGPIALLPLGEAANAHQSALVWTLPATQASAILAQPDSEFLATLQARFGFRTGRFTRVAKRHAYPLQLVLAEEQIRSHLVLVGNAAHFLHPVAGQGFNLALRDCVCLVETLGEAAATGKSPGDLAVLRTYLDRQLLDQKITIEFSDRLVRLFSNNDLPLIALRHLGLLSLESFAPLKQQFTAQTMGTAGRRFRWQNKASLTSGNTVHLIAEPHSAVDASDKECNTDFDIVIVGAGLVGAALACTLAQLEQATHLRIAIIEAGGDAPVYRAEHFDPRVVALTHASQQLLARIGCWDAIAHERACAYQHMTVWDGEGTAAIEFDSADVRQPHLGHIVENSVAVRVLRQRIAQFPHITLIQPATVIDVHKQQPSQPFVKVILSNGLELTTALLIAADGAQSNVRELTGFSTREWDYDQRAIITTVHTEKSHDFTAWQRFMQTGPLAFLPLQNNGDSHSCSIVWSAETALAEELMALNNEQFCARVGAAFEWRLGNITSCAERFALPLRQRHATTYIQPGIVLVGDAAHNIHPLAGQGVNLGLLDVIALAQEIERAWVRKIPLADYSLLRRYQRQRLSSNLGMMSAMESFHYLFRQRSLVTTWLRNTGMRQLNALPAVKKMIINAAMGIS